MDCGYDSATARIEEKVEESTEALLAGLKENGYNVFADPATESDNRCMILNILRRHFYPRG